MGTISIPIAFKNYFIPLEKYLFLLSNFFVIGVFPLLMISELFTRKLLQFVIIIVFLNNTICHH